MTELLLYNIDMRYVAYLREIDPLVPKLDGGKDKRPFAGVVLEMNGIDYFAPLTSYKEKFSRMKSGIDFILIAERLGAINLNNMIPAHRSCLSVIETKFADGDTEQDTKYKHLIFNQIEWCNKEENKSAILNNAERLHRLITNGTAPARLKARCCDFVKMEQAMLKYS